MWLSMGVLLVSAKPVMRELVGRGLLGPSVLVVSAHADDDTSYRYE